MRTLHARPLTRGAYAPFGDVLAGTRTAPADPADDLGPGRLANQGRARAWDRLVRLQDLRPGRAAPNFGVFRTVAWPDPSLVVRLLERHPHSTQAFLPMTARRFLVTVAPPGDRPDPHAIVSFVAEAGQGISYHPGTWHHPLVALDVDADFGVLVWEDGTSGDCELVHFAEAEQVDVRWT